MTIMAGPLQVMLQYDADSRISAAEGLLHPYFDDLPVELRGPAA